ncbi:Hypothetical protein A7982_04704 [Minicystis rosea]|nr:Hypothetical protein A7982_04704 [Minicystis rosea]
MRIRRWLFPPVAAILGAAAVTLAAPRRGPTASPSFTPSPAFAGDPQAAPGPAVALLATRPGGSHTSLYLARPGDTTTAIAPVATFTHREDAAVRGATVPGTSTVLAVADTQETRDLSFAASLFRVAPHQPPVRLCEGVVHASRPLVTAGGRVFVSRGVAGPDHEGAFRADDLTIDEIDPQSSTARTVHAFHGYLAFLAGAHGAEILVYRVGAGGADLASVHPDTGAVRVLAKLLPFARDFSVGDGAVIFQERDEHDSRAFTIDRIDLGSGARTRLHTGPSATLAPFAWPGGGIAWSSNDQAGLSILTGDRPLAAAPLGRGVDMVRAVSADGSWIAALHTVAGKLPIPFAVDTRTGAAAAIRAVPDARVEIAGFVAGGAS